MSCGKREDQSQSWVSDFPDPPKSGRKRHGRRARLRSRGGTAGAQWGEAHSGAGFDSGEQQGAFAAAGLGAVTRPSPVPVQWLGYRIIEVFAVSRGAPRRACAERKVWL